MLYRITVLFAVFICLHSGAQAGIDPPPGIGARSVGLGYAYTAVGSNFWSLFHNPAGIAGTSAIETGVYVERRFNLSELTYGHAGIVFPFGGKQAIGAELGSYGFDTYRENRAALSYGVMLLERISLGAKINYANIIIAGLGSTNALVATVGGQVHINKTLSLGFTGYNVNRAGIQSLGGTDDIPTLLTAGVMYRPNEKVMIVADVQKDIDHPVSWRGGIEYAFVPSLYARLGMSTEPLSVNAGLGLLYRNLSVDAAFGFHERLGYTPHISLSYRFAGRES